MGKAIIFVLCMMFLIVLAGCPSPKCDKGPSLVGKTLTDKEGAQYVLVKRRNSCSTFYEVQRLVP